MREIEEIIAAAFFETHMSSTAQNPDTPGRYATEIVAALDAAGFVIAPKEPLPEMVAAWWRVKNGHHFHDEPPPSDTSDYAAYRAMLEARPK